MHRLLIVDDEPLVQIGLKSMIARDFPDIEAAGSASNGREALELIGQLHPDIVIADIKMPIMTGLELLKESTKQYGPVPVFIMLTSYEEFDLVRQALANQAVEYLVKIELTPKILRSALDKAVRRVEEHVSRRENQPGDVPSIEEFRQNVMIRLLSHQFQDLETLRQSADGLQLRFDYDRYIAACGRICREEDLSSETASAGSADAGLSADSDGAGQSSGSAGAGLSANSAGAGLSAASGTGGSVSSPDPGSRLLVLYSSCLNMTREIVERYVPCYTVSNDLRHFTLIFYFDSGQAVAGIMGKIHEAFDNACSMINGYFNTRLLFGIGTAVSDPLDISVSYEEAKTALSQADAANPVRMFSHIVGANRRSGKDKLIASIRQYIDDHLDGKLQLNEVAEVFGLSPAYLSVIFKKNGDMGFSEYVYTKKIEKARQMLLGGDMKIYEVADALGFESAFYFSKVFKRVDGHSPREYIQSKIDTEADPE